MLFEREVSDMKNKLRKALLGELCALCVQSQTAYAIELPDHNPARVYQRLFSHKKQHQEVKYSTSWCILINS